MFAVKVDVIKRRQFLFRVRSSSSLQEGTHKKGAVPDFARRPLPMDIFFNTSVSLLGIGVSDVYGISLIIMGVIGEMTTENNHPKSNNIDGCG